MRLSKYIGLTLLGWVTFYSSTPMAKAIVREPAVAGAFYPENEGGLRKKVDNFLNNVYSLNIDDRIKAVLVPHAGYAFSGQIAALAYKQLIGEKFDTVILLGPSHRVAFPGISVYFKEGAYKTPLGLVEIDSEVAELLISQHKNIQFYPPAHTREHSLEVQLPFLQVILPGVKIVPIIMGGQTKENVEILINALEKVFNQMKDKKILLVTTCDCSHYYSYDKAVELDKVAMRAVRSMDYENLLSLVAQGKCEMDAYGPVAATMEIAKRLGANRVEILKYANSGDITGDKTKVVGYAAVLLYKNGILCCPPISVERRKESQ